MTAQEIKCEDINCTFVVIVTNENSQITMQQVDQHLQDNQTHKLSIKLIHQ